MIITKFTRTNIGATPHSRAKIFLDLEFFCQEHGKGKVQFNILSDDDVERLTVFVMKAKGYDMNSAEAIRQVRGNIVLMLDGLVASRKEFPREILYDD